MMRIGLFLLTNIAVLLVLAVVMSLLGYTGITDETGMALDLEALLVFSALLGFGGSFVSLLLSKWMAKKMAGVQIIEEPSNQAEAWLVQTVRELARRADVGMPEVGVFPAQQANAFATGWNRNKALVAVSQGMLQRFSQDEIRAVMAHEIGHVANGDMITLSLVQGVLNTFVIFLSRVIGFFVDKVVFRNERGLGIGFFLTSIVMQILLGILASAIVAWFSRFREYRADAAGANLANRQGMINALRRLKAETELPNELPESMEAFGINQGMRSGLRAMFASHPPLDDRIRALEENRHG